MLLPIMSRLAATDPKATLPQARLAADRTLFDPAATLDLMTGYYLRFIRSADAPWVKRDRRIHEDIVSIGKAVACAPELFRLYVGWCGETDPISGATEVSDADLAKLRDTLAGTQDPNGKSVSNPLGMFLAGLFLPPVDQFLKQRANCLADREAARTLAALRVYQLRKGQLPESLQGLVDEKILPAVPLDPFSDKPLLYSKAKRLLWSVGKNETDEGGSGDPADRFYGSDYVWPVPPP